MTHKGQVTELTAAQAIVRFLQAQFSERDGDRRRLIPAMFGIFGHGNVAGMGQALQEYGHALPYLQGRNEQSMVHIASAFAKASGRRSTLAVTASIGPGSTNMVTGAATATINRLPALLFPSDVYVSRRQGPVLQQLEHALQADVSVNDCFRPVSKFFDRIVRPEQLLTALPEAMRVLTSPAEVGAVTISLPQDVQSQAYAYPTGFFAESTWRIARPLPERDQISRAAAVLALAERPIIVAGGGVHYSEALEELSALSQALGIPVAETFAGKGAMQTAGWRTLGGLGLEGGLAANEVARCADLVICVGTRLTDFATASQTLFQNPQVQFININVDARDAGKQGALPIVADAREALTALYAEALGKGARPRSGYQREVTTHQSKWSAVLDASSVPVAGERMSSAELITVLNDFACLGDTVIAAAGGPPGDLLKMWRATGGKRCHLEFGNSCMGYEIPAGIGVRLAQSGGEVYVYIGDGTYLMNPTELVTAVQEGLKITVIIAENHGFQVIRRLQLTRAGTSFGNEFRHREGSPSSLEDRQHAALEGRYLELDLAGTARGFGATSYRAETPQDFRQALQQARDQPNPAVIVVPVEPHRFLPSGGAWFDVAPAEVSSDAIVRGMREQYEVDRVAQRSFSPRAD